MATAEVPTPPEEELDMKPFVKHGIVPFSIITIVLSAIRIQSRLPFALEAPEFAQPTVASTGVVVSPAEAGFAMPEVIGLAVFILVAALQLVPKVREVADRSPAVSVAFALPTLAAVVFAVAFGIIMTATLCASFGTADEWTCKAASGTFSAVSTCAYDPVVDTRNMTGQGPCKAGPSAIELGADACVCQRSLFWPSDAQLLLSEDYSKGDEAAKTCPSGSKVYSGLTLCTDVACTQGTQGSGGSCTCEKTATGSQTRCFITELMISTHSCASIDSGRSSNEVNLYMAIITAWPLVALYSLLVLRVIVAASANKSPESEQPRNPAIFLVALPLIIPLFLAAIGWYLVVGYCVYGVLQVVTPMGCCASRWPAEKRAILSREGAKCILQPTQAMWMTGDERAKYEADKAAAAAAAAPTA